jgi:TraX protein
MKLLAYPVAFRVHPQAIEWLKWAALVCMVIDHVNHYALEHSMRWMYQVGRLAFPLFAFVLGHNLAQRGGALAFERALPKLLIAGVFAQPFFHAMRPDDAINIMFTLALGAWLAYPQAFQARIKAVWFRRLMPWLVLAVALLFVRFDEYQGIGIFLVFTSALWSRYPTAGFAVLWGCALLWLTYLNGSKYSLLVIFVVFVARFPLPALPRLRWWFYAIYPLHLALLWVFAP